MKRLSIELITVIGAVLGFTTVNAQSIVEYELVFTSNWEAHGSLPGSNAHFSPLAIATHNSNITFFEMGGISSDGVESIAELGSTGTFTNEVNTAISNGTANEVIIGDDLFFNGPGRTITVDNITINESHPLISIISMIAPSPDWIVAANNISLKDQTGAWKQTITLDLFPYDAGTEEGNSFSLSNPATNPKEPISSLQGVSPFNNEKMATVQINLKTVLSVSDFNFEENLSFFPNPAKDEFIITNSNNSHLKAVEIYNVSGSLVKVVSTKANNNSTRVNIENLSQGLYLIKFISQSGNSKVEKLTVSR